MSDNTILEEIKLRISLNKNLTQKHLNFLKSNPKILPKVSRDNKKIQRRILKKDNVKRSVTYKSKPSQVKRTKVIKKVYKVPVKAPVKVVKPVIKLPVKKPVIKLPVKKPVIKLPPKIPIKIPVKPVIKLPVKKPVIKLPVKKPVIKLPKK
tara:strand:- start:1721 stop:2173 length:453 start_codon:yes stop_codon:yes gene_type:complete